MDNITPTPEQVQQARDFIATLTPEQVQQVRDYLEPLPLVAHMALVLALTDASCAVP